MGRVLIRIVPLLALLLALGWMVQQRLNEPEGSRRGGDREKRPVPVEVAEIERGPIELRRTFSGTLEAGAEFDVAPKVGGRIERLAVGLSDAVSRGQPVAELDSAEHQQAVARAQADLAVARAMLGEAKSGLRIADRELDRLKTLQNRGLASESLYDAAVATQMEKRAGLLVAEAQVLSAEATLEEARIRLGYTRVAADWSGAGTQRVVAEQYVDEGDTVSANTPLLRIVELDPIEGVIHVTEKEYPYFTPGQPISLTTDAWPDQTFDGKVDRIAPVFQQTTRQARVELEVENRQLQLKPGMFIRVSVLLERREEASLLPVEALTRRGGEQGLFLLDEEQQVVHWRAVKTGIRQGEQIELLGDEVTGRVVIQGQQQLDEGSAVVVIAANSGTEPQ